MDRRKFIKGSAIIGATIAIPELLQASSGLFDTTTSRKVYRVLNTDKTLVGTLPVLRAFAGDHNDYVSPFVFFDEFGPVKVNPKDKPLRVDAHPHAGIIPTTYFLEGNGHHRDSLNYDFQISKGDFMMFTSGRGAIHMEETGQKLYDNGGIYHGFQIWLNSPAKYKFVDPAANVFHTDKMSEVVKKDYSVKVVLGSLSGAASKIASLPRVREALLRRQRAFKEAPGLVADGRDMGTVVFPQAEVKIFLTADASERARRRYLELKEKGHDVNIGDLLSEIQARDERDMNRAVAPLKPASDAYMLDSTNKSIEQVLDEVLNVCKKLNQA